MHDKELNSQLKIFHVDMNFVSLRLDYLKKWIEKLAELGYNAILWEIEDKVRLDVLGDIAYPEAMGKSEFHELLEYSKKLGLEPIPLVQIFGHGEYVMKHERYRHFREQEKYHDCYCTSSPAVKEFLSDLIAEEQELFGPLKFFHLGGDEAYVFATCEKCKSYADIHSRNRLYADHLDYLSRPLKESCIRPGVWSDMILHYPNDTDEISKDYLIWDWNYWDGVNEPDTTVVWGHPQPCTAENIPQDALEIMPEILSGNGKIQSFYTVDVLGRLGFDVVLCSSTRAFGDSIFCGHHEVHAPNVFAAARKAKTGKLLGHCVTSWAVRIFNYELQENWIELGALGDTDVLGDFDEVLNKLGCELFGVEPADFYRGISLISAEFPLAASGNVYVSGIQWSKLKDSISPPRNYLRDTLDRYKNEQPEHYESLKQMLKKAADDISAGREILVKFASSATASYELIDQWLIAADFQQRLLWVAQQVFNVFEDQPHENKSETLSKLAELKKDYIAYAQTWMTPANAHENASLIFDHIREFLDS